MSPPHVCDPGRVKDIAKALKNGEITSESLVTRYLDRISAVDGDVNAWIHVLREEALKSARTLDSERKAGKLRSLLHGIPVAVKDVIHVAGLPTKANSESRADVLPETADATVVSQLRAAGAIILGKVHTTEYAYFESLPPTRNPWDLTRTPGGSSAGSAAAIASGTVPLALGTQTAASVNRPAAYCGIGGYKPSTLSIGGAGIVPFAPTFDTVGGLGATARDAVLLVAAIAPDHLGLYDLERLPAVDGATIIVLEDPFLEQATPGTKSCLEAFTEQLANAGLPVRKTQSPVSWEQLLLLHRTIILAEFGRTHARLPRDKVTPRIAQDLDRGLAIPDQEYHDALHELAILRRQFWTFFAPTDILVMPATPDVAPDASTSGNPAFIAPVTALGGPIATVRAGFEEPTGMPVGALLFSAPGSDARLASFLLSEVGEKLDL